MAKRRTSKQRPSTADPSAAAEETVVGTGQELSGEQDCARLTALARQLTQELAGLRETLAAVEAERDEYRRLLYPSVWQQFGAAELRQFAEDDREEGCRPLDDFVGELEGIVHGRTGT
jgi:hypothetical protein